MFGSFNYQGNFANLGHTMFLGLSGAQNQPDRRLLAGLPVVLFQPANVKLHLPFVPCLEHVELEVNCHEPAKIAMVMICLK